MRHASVDWCEQATSSKAAMSSEWKARMDNKAYNKISTEFPNIVIQMEDRTTHQIVTNPPPRRGKTKMVTQTVHRSLTGDGVGGVITVQRYLTGDGGSKVTKASYKLQTIGTRNPAPCFFKFFFTCARE